MTDNSDDPLELDVKNAKLGENNARGRLSIKKLSESANKKKQAEYLANAKAEAILAGQAAQKADTDSRSSVNGQGTRVEPKEIQQIKQDTATALALLDDEVATLEAEEAEDAASLHAKQVQADYYRATVNQPQTASSDLGDIDLGVSDFVGQLQNLMSPEATASPESDAEITADGVSVLGSSRYPRIAYEDRMNGAVSSEPEKEVLLPGGNLVRFSEDDSKAENDSPTFLLDALIFIQGVEVSAHLAGEIRVTKNGTAGTNEVSFTLTNDSDRFVWTERNLASIYGKSAIKAKAPFALDFIKANEDDINERVERLNGTSRQITDLDTSGAQTFDASALGLMTERAFTQNEKEKKALFAYKGDPTRNPPIRNPKNVISHARFDLVPHRAVFNRMDPVRIFSLYPFRVAGKGHEDGRRKELWCPEFTGYVATASLDEDEINNESKITITCTGFKQSILQGMKISADLTSGLAVPLEALGFSLSPRAQQGFTAEQTAQDQAVSEQARTNTDGFFNINNTQFYSDIITNKFGHPLPEKPLEEAVRELLVANEPITTEKNGRGVRGVQFGGNFYYDSTQTRENAQTFLEQWHKFCLFGPKRRPWTREEAEAVGEGTTTDGEYAPNKVRLWFLLPKSGTGPANLADLSQVSIRQTHDVNWTNRLEVLTNFVEALDYNFMVAPCGDLICEFSFADFRPEDFGEFKDSFRIEKNAVASQFGAEQEVPPAGLVVTTGFAAGVSQPNEVAQVSLTKTFVYSPYIAARYGVRIDTESIPFLTARDKPIAQQRAVMLYQRRLARAHALNLQFGYRPFLLPNRPIHHVRRGRIGNVVSNETTITLGKAPKAENQIGLEHVRLFTGFYRTADDLEKLNDLQQIDLESAGMNPHDLLSLLGIDVVDSSDSIERQVFTTVAAGESTPTSNRVGWAADSVIAPASGIYVLDIDKVKAAQYPTPVNNTAHDDPGEDATIEDPIAEPTEPPTSDTYKFAKNPLDAIYVISHFGRRNDPNVTKLHAGIDLRARKGTPAFAVENGTIIQAGSQSAPSTPVSGHDAQPGAGGNIVLLKTDSGFLVQYLHLDASGRGLVALGERVTAAQQIAVTGSSGVGKVAQHLHFDVIPQQTAIDAGRATREGSFSKSKIDGEVFLPGPVDGRPRPEHKD